MRDKDLILEMYHFTISLALGLKPGEFKRHRDKWNFLMGECEKRKNKL
jgi:hypothetical protein